MTSRLRALTLIITIAAANSATASPCSNFFSWITGHGFRYDPSFSEKHSGYRTFAPTPGSKFDEGMVNLYAGPAREEHRLSVRDGLVVDATGAPFDTRGGVTGADGNPVAIFAMDAEGRIYASKFQQMGYFHHTSLLAGEPAAAAGEIEIVKGRIKRVNDHSGHYRPPGFALQQLLNQLEKDGADIGSVSVRAYGQNLPVNSGAAFTRGHPIGKVLVGVDPNTLYFSKIRETLDPNRRAQAIEYARDHTVKVSETGLILDGHHRAWDAILNGRPVDVEISVR